MVLMRAAMPSSIWRTSALLKGSGFILHRNSLHPHHADQEGQAVGDTVVGFGDQIRGGYMKGRLGEECIHRKHPPFTFTMLPWVRGRK